MVLWAGDWGTCGRWKTLPKKRAHAQLPKGGTGGARKDTEAAKLSLLWCPSLTQAPAALFCDVEKVLCAEAVLGSG